MIQLSVSGLGAVQDNNTRKLFIRLLPYPPSHPITAKNRTLAATLATQYPVIPARLTIAYPTTIQSAQSNCSGGCNRGGGGLLKVAEQNARTQSHYFSFDGQTCGDGLLLLVAGDESVYWAGEDTHF